MEHAGGPSRRAVLTAAAVLVTTGPLAACRTLPVIGRGAPDPDVATADDAAQRERALLAAYDAAMQAVPSLAGRLSPLRDEHAQHLAALVPATLPTTQPAGTPTPTPSADPRSGTAVPADPAAALAVLRQLESDTATRHGGAAVRCGRGLAVVLASAAASEASHVQALQ